MSGMEWADRLPERGTRGRLSTAAILAEIDRENRKFARVLRYHGIKAGFRVCGWYSKQRLNLVGAFFADECTPGDLVCIMGEPPRFVRLVEYVQNRIGGGGWWTHEPVTVWFEYNASGELVGKGIK